MTVPRDRVSQNSSHLDRSEEYRGSLPDDLHDQLLVTRATVEIDEDDLLPRPELHPATGKWHIEIRTEQRCPHIGVPVAITLL